MRCPVCGVVSTNAVVVKRSRAHPYESLTSSSVRERARLPRTLQLVSRAGLLFLNEALAKKASADLHIRCRLCGLADSLHFGHLSDLQEHLVGQRERHAVNQQTHVLCVACVSRIRSPFPMNATSSALPSSRSILMWDCVALVTRSVVFVKNVVSPWRPSIGIANVIT